MSVEIANNENNVIRKLDSGTIIEWQFEKIDDEFFAVMVKMRYANPHCGTLIETGDIIKTFKLGDTEEEARKYWNSLIRHKKEGD